MRRLFWVAVGAGAAGYTAYRARKFAHGFTPAGVADRVDDLRVWGREFADEVRAGMIEREAELRDALGLDDEAGEFVGDGNGGGDRDRAAGTMNGKLERNGAARRGAHRRKGT